MTPEIGKHEKCKSDDTMMDHAFTNCDAIGKSTLSKTSVDLKCLDVFLITGSGDLSFSHYSPFFFVLFAVYNYN